MMIPSNSFRNICSGSMSMETLYETPVAVKSCAGTGLAQESVAV
nr:hypothetical protein [Buttiauxella sp. BIGb0471]